MSNIADEVIVKFGYPQLDIKMPEDQGSVLDITLEGEARKIGFGIGTVDSRDRMLSAMATYLASTEDAEGPKVALESAGRAILFVQA